VLKYETGKVSSKGLVVIPIEVRRALSIEEGDKLEITVDDGHAIMNVVKKKSILNVFGIIRTDKAILPVNKIKQLVKDDIVKDIVAEGRESYE
jgi:antitoxin PrlF